MHAKANLNIALPPVIATAVNIAVASSRRRTSGYGKATASVHSKSREGWLENVDCESSSVQEIVFVANSNLTNINSVIHHL